MRYLPNGKQMSEADAHTIHEIGIPSLVLMERAALQIVETMHKIRPPLFFYRLRFIRKIFPQKKV